MTKLNQLIAIESGVKTKAQKAGTELYRVIGKPQLFAGLSRKYTPRDDEGDQLPPESTLVQVNVAGILRSLAESLIRLYDVELTKEKANAGATADIVVEGETLLASVPVTYLLFLEKQIVDIGTFVANLPTLDPASAWTLDPNTGSYAAAPVSTVKTKKIPRNWVRSPATDKHPAQVEVYHEDVIVGQWEKTDFSGAIPAVRKAELVARVDALQRAVKFARESANGSEVTDAQAGATIFSYLFS